ncbi:MAG: peptidoglycan-binding protein [Clostridia bacterium]|nr:peptidoglycan-binding protein [Clostridia bacterium]
MATVKIGSARIDERGKAYGGKAGDQGKEVSIQNWYDHPKGWRVIRPKRPDVAEMIAADMQAACDNAKIGYDQWQRLTLYNKAKEVGFDCSKVTDKCETDCSALVRVCLAYAGIMVDNFRTTNQAKLMLATGEFTELTSSKYTKQSAYLKRGDVLVTKTQGHTVVVLTDGDEAVDYALGDRTLRKGMEGEDVRQMQEARMTLGYPLPKYGADGDFGSETMAAVMSFQAHYNLNTDGVYGSDTHDTLQAALEAMDNAPGDEGGETVEDPVVEVVTDIDIKSYEIDALDLSQYNTSQFAKIDWAAIRDKVGFLILRCGITRLSTKPLGVGADTHFERMAAKCQEYGIPFWAYYYSRAKKTERVIEEAEFAYNIAAKYNPVGYALDVEEKGVKVVEWFNVIRTLGATKTMLYIGHNWYPVYKLSVDEDGFISCCDALWIPRYGENDGTAKKRYTPAYPCDLWQYSSVFAFEGIPDKTLDVNKITGQRRSLAWFRGEE